MTDLYFSAEQIRVMRDATHRAISKLSAFDEAHRDAVARYVILAFKAGINCPEHLAEAAVKRFLALNAGNVLDWRSTV